MSVPPKAPPVYKPNSLRVATPPVYRPQTTQQITQPKQGNTFKLENRPAPPVYRPRINGNTSQQKSSSGSRQIAESRPAVAQRSSGRAQSLPVIEQRRINTGNTIQRLYGSNTPAKFETEQGSVYTVVSGDVSRAKYDGTPHSGNGKNIFYVPQSDADEILQDGGSLINGRVNGTTLTYTVSDASKTFNLSKAPKVGLSPVDVILDSSGNFESNHRLHVGHRITKILSNGPATSEASSNNNHNNGHRRGCCFLTSACVTSRNLPDDCEELTVLRSFRDGYMKTIPGGAGLISQYYAIAPEIVAAIEARPERQEIYDSMYGTIQCCVELIRADANGQALECYQSMVRSLLCLVGLEMPGLQEQSLGNYRQEPQPEFNLLIAQ